MPGERGADEVVVLQWPDDEDRRAALRHRNVPRLLLVPCGVQAPVVVDPFEDWVRVPADEADVRARLTTLSARLASTREERPLIDDDGVLRYRGRWVPLSPVENRLLTALLDRYGSVVGRQVLTKAGWVDGVPSRNALDVKIFRLRQRIEPLGLTIRTVRARGYLLESPP